MSISDKQRLVAARQKARHYIVQGLYQWKIGGALWSDIAAQFLVEYSMPKQSANYFKEILQGTIEQAPDLDRLLQPCMDLQLNELGPVELSILRMATYELKEKIDIPYRAVINEAINLAKKFAAADSYKYINAVLDKLALQLRAVETSA